MTHFENGAVLDLTPVSFSHDNQDGFHIDRSGALNWGHFDPGEGLKVRIVYVSDTAQKITLGGMAAGMASVNYYTQSGQTQRAFISVLSAPIRSSALTLVVLGIIGMSAFQVLFGARVGRIFIIAAVALGMLLGAFGELLWEVPPSPPF